MIDRIPNPFKDDWKKLDREEFEEDILGIIDDLYEAKDLFEVYNIRSDFADMIGEIILLHVYKQKEEIEVVEVKDLPDYMIEELDLYDEKQSYIPMDLIENLYSIEEYAEILDKAVEKYNKPDKKNDWLRRD